jgi:hypothetical protein
VLSTLPFGTASAGQDEVEYYAVLVDGKKIGSMVHTRSVEGEVVTTSEEMKMTISRGGMLLAINTMEKTIESIKGEPLGFEFVQNMSGMSQKATGKVNKAGKLEVGIEMMGTRQEKVMAWPEGALMYEGLRLTEVEKGLAKGTHYGVKVFSPSLILMAQTPEQASLTTKVTVGDKADVDLFGRVVNLTKVEVLMLMPASAIMPATELKTTSFVSEDFRSLKTSVPMMGMELEIIACSKDFALSKNDVVDFLSKLVVKSPEILEDVGSKKSITYHLVPKEGAEIAIPESDSQKVSKGKNGTILVKVEPAKAAKGVEFPYKGEDKTALEALKPTTYLQSDSKEVLDLALHAVGGTKDAGEAVRQIESFVAGYITAKDLSVGYATAAEVAKSRQGDCTEHAVLSAAMCRAVGIPARVVFGIVYVDNLIGHTNVFGGHAWTEAYIGDKWVGLDATRAPNGYGAGHITMAIGSEEPGGFFAMVNSLGYFEIVKVDVVNGETEKASNK